MKLVQSTKKSYYWAVYKKHWKSISVLVLLMLTLPLYIFITLPPVAIVKPVPQNHIVNVTNQTTTQIISSRNVSVNATQGQSVFLSKQAPPPLIDSDIVICIDTSGSMAGTRLTNAKIAIESLVSALNKSAQTLQTNDRIGLVNFGGLGGSWNLDAAYQTGLGYVNNQSFLNNFESKTNAIATGGSTGSSTDIWAGLNFSLQLLVNNPRTGPSLKSVILLTDGVDNDGPFSTPVQNGDYTGFLSLASNYSTNYQSPLSASPVAFARNNGIKIDTIGLYDSGSYPQFDANFLSNISLNQSYGTFGEYFAGNDPLSLTESFLKARDSASGWVQLVSDDFNMTGSNSKQLYTFNVTENQRRLKWDVNWENTSISIDPVVTFPNGTILDLNKNTLPNNFNLISTNNPFSLIIDFPEHGIWKFKIIWSNISGNETVLDRLSSYQPPIFIDKVTQVNSTNLNGNQQSSTIIFGMTVSNKNPLFSFHDITPVLVANFSAFNYSYSWSPAIVPDIAFNSSTSFNLNITFTGSVQIQGSFLMLVNCSEGYYDAYEQPLSLDSQPVLSNSVETYTSTQTVLTTVASTSIGYNYNREVFTQLNYIGFILTFMLLFAITSLYIRSKESDLKKLASQFKSSFLRNRTSIEAGLSNAGVDLSNVSMDQLLSQISHLDELGTAIGTQTGTILSTEDLIKVASGVTTSKVANRLSNKTGNSLQDILDVIANASSIEEISQKLHMSYDDFMFIITPDEQVDGFQKFMKSLVKPMGIPLSSRMFVSDDINLVQFRSKLKNSTTK